MRFFLTGMVWVLGSLSGAAAADEPTRFEVPRIDREQIASERPEKTPTHEVVLAADVVARPGETPAEALSRALHGPSAKPAVALQR